MSPYATYHKAMGKRDAGLGTPAKETSGSRINAFEVVDFVQTTRRWHDRENPRDAGEFGRLPKKHLEVE